MYASRDWAMKFVAEEISNKRLDLGVRGEEDVRPEIEDVAVDLDRAGVSTDTVFALEGLPVALPGSFAASAQPSDPRARHRE